MLKTRILEELFFLVMLALFVLFFILLLSSLECARETLHD
jgi:hypothetical protein